MSMVRAQVNLSLEELLQLKHLNGTLLSLLAFWALASLDMQAGALLVLAVGLCLAALAKPHWLSRVPSRVWRYAGPLLLVFVAVDLMTSLSDLIPPLVRMITWLLLYRNLAPRRQREDMQLILLCLFSVVLSGALTVSLLFAFQILLFTPLAMAQLLLVCILDRGEDSQKASAEWDGFRWWPLLCRLRRVLDWRVLSLGALLFGFVVLVSTLLFILTPRVNLNQNLPFLQMRTQAMTGFSENVQFGNVTELVQDRAVAVRVDVPSLEAVDPDPYWRMLVLDEHVGDGFRMSKSLQAMRDRRGIRARAGDLAPGSARQDKWTFYMEGGVSRFLPVPGRHVVMRFQTARDLDFYAPVSVYALDSVTQSFFSYEIEGLQFDRRLPVAPEDAADLKAPLPKDDTGSPDLRYPLTTRAFALSRANREALAQINQSILQGRKLNATAYSQAATEYLWSRYTYSLRPNGQVRPGGPSDDPVVNWLLSGDQGHCELFAGAFILLAREAGIPARMVIGFAGGAWNSVENYFVIRQSEAHAWVEVFDAESDTWLRVDPTPGSGSSDPDVAAVGARGRTFDSGWNAWVDSLRIQWYRRIVNFEQDDQIAMARTLKDLAGDVSTALRESLHRIGLALKVWVKDLFGESWLKPLLLLAVLFFGLYTLWLSRSWLWAHLFRSEPSGRRLRTERRTAGRYLQRFNRRGLSKEDASVYADLRAIRYGPKQAVVKSAEVFVLAKRALRRRRGAQSNLK